MFKMISLLMLCSFASLLATQEIPQTGRYQMVGLGAQSLYLLDTTTGYVWKATAKQNWGGIPDSWQLIIATPPSLTE